MPPKKRTAAAKHVVDGVYRPPTPRRRAVEPDVWIPPDDFVAIRTPKIDVSARCPIRGGCKIEHRRLYGSAPLSPCYDCEWWDLPENKDKTPF